MYRTTMITSTLALAAAGVFLVEFATTNPSAVTTRASSDLTALSATAVAAADPAPTMAAASATSPQKVVFSKPNIVTDDDANQNSLRELTSVGIDTEQNSALAGDVLDGLGLATRLADADPNTPGSRDLRGMSAGAIRQLGKAEFHVEAQSNTQMQGLLHSLILQAINEGRPDEYVDSLLNEAAEAGLVAVPQSLVTPEGSVDTKTLIAAIVDKAAATSDGVRPTPRPTIRRLEKSVTYTVKYGDSLAAIAYQHYGTTSAYQWIFAANKENLSSPDKIQAGQTLIIPAI